MQDQWLKIKQCFTQMREAPDQPPAKCQTTQQLAMAAAKFMKPRQDVVTQRKLAQRIKFICFGEQMKNTMLVFGVAMWLLALWFIPWLIICASSFVGGYYIFDHYITWLDKEFEDFGKW